MSDSSLYVLSLCQSVRLGEDDDGQISSQRDPGEGGSVRGRSQDGGRTLLLLLLQVSSRSTLQETVWKAQDAQMKY